MTVRVGLVQLDCSTSESVAHRVTRTLELIDKVAPDVDLLVLPELWHVGAFDVDAARQHAQAIDGPLVSSMGALAAEHKIWLHGGSFCELADDGRHYNTSVLFAPDGSLVVSYRKIHLFGFDTGEATLLTAGSELVIVPTPLGATALATCYDLRFPELFRALTAAGAEAVLLASSWPLARIAHWRTLVAARAIENQLPVVACNATGSHAGVVQGGESMIVDATGLLLAKADHDPALLGATVVSAVTARTRVDFPVLLDRRL